MVMAREKMKRCRWLVGGIVAVGLTALTACQVGSTADKTEVQRLPNIIVLYADDLGYGDLGSYGSPNIRTPQLDQLAAQGQRWTDFYVAAPVCSPSRGALMTGNYPERSGLYGRTRAVLFPGESGQIPDSVTTLPEALKAEGYSTAMFGKWHLGDQPDGLPTRHGFDEWLGIPYSNDMDWMIGPTSPELFAAAKRGEGEFVKQAIADRKAYTLEPKNEYWDVPLIQSSVENGFQDEVIARPAEQSLLTKLYTEKSVDYIEQQVKTDQPFFLYVAYAMPHVPLFRSPEFADSSLGGRYGDVIEEIDWSVGEIRKALEQQGIAENTLVVFSSDNGPWVTMDSHSGSAGPFRNGKATTFEGGVRVPGIFWWPGTIKPAVVHGIGSVVDLYATIMTLVGGKLETEIIDAVDLSSTLLEGDDSSRESFAYYRSGELFAFRLGQYKAHFITQGAYGQPPARVVHERPLLYHLGEDPGEKFDIAEKQPQVLAEILAAVQIHQSKFTVAEPIFDTGR